MEREKQPVLRALAPIQFVNEIREKIMQSHERCTFLSQEPDKEAWLAERRRRRRLNHVWNVFWDATDEGLQVKCFQIGDDNFEVKVITQEPVKDKPWGKAH